LHLRRGSASPDTLLPCHKAGSHANSLPGVRGQLLLADGRCAGFERRLLCDKCNKTNQEANPSALVAADVRALVRMPGPLQPALFESLCALPALQSQQLAVTGKVSSRRPVVDKNKWHRECRFRGRPVARPHFAAHLRCKDDMPVMQDS